MADWKERDERAVWHPFTPYPIPEPRARLARAEGSYVYDDKGKRYFDATSSWWCNIHGHCHPRLVAALQRQAGTMDQVMFAPHSHEPAIELSERLLARLGRPFSKVFFSDDGSTAVETALKMSLQYWKVRGETRNTFVSLDGAYHGDTLGAVSVGGVDSFHHHFEVMKDLSLRVPVPESEEAVARAEALIVSRASKAAALIVEPLLMGAAGMHVYSVKHLDALVRIARREGLLIIYDEVLTGFGRTGTMFAFEQGTERPDLICLSKGLTSGMLPLAVTVASDSVFQEFRGGPDKAFYHGHTFTANPLGCAVALESLGLFEEEKVLERNLPLSALFREEAARFSALPHVGRARSLGMVWAIDIYADAECRTKPSPLNAPGWKIAGKLWEQGYWLRPLHNTIYVVPPYSSTTTELRRLFAVLYSEVSNESYYH